MSETVAALRELVRTFPSALLGYSGGVDSAYLAVVLRRALGRGRIAAAIGRTAYGLAITPRRLDQVERAEAYLRDLGVTGDLRVRHHGERARIEVEPQWIPWLEQRLAAVTSQLGALGFGVVEVDPRGYRRGSLVQALRPRV